MELYKVADALVYLGVINDPREMQNIKLIQIDPIEGLIEVDYAGKQLFSIEGDALFAEGDPDDEEPADEEPGMTLAEAQLEVERRSKMR